MSVSLHRTVETLARAGRPTPSADLGPRAAATERRLKTLHFHLNGDLYGASRSLLRLTARMVEDGHRPVVVLGTEGPLREELVRHGVEVRPTRWMAAVERHLLKTPLGPVWLGLRAVVSIPVFCRLMIRERPDLVHTNASVILTSGVAAKLTGTPHVWHVRESFSDFPALWRVYRRYVSLMSDRIACVSRYVAGEFHPAAGKKVRVVYDGVPDRVLNARGGASPAEPRIRPGAQGRATVGLVGRINLDRKGHRTFVQAAAEVLVDHPRTRFLVVGSAHPRKRDHEARLRALIRDLSIESHVVLAGELRDLRTIYGLLDVVVVPSTLPEGFGNTAAEAMGFGLPVVGTDLGGTAEVVEHGRTGLLFPPGDARALAQCLDLLLSDRARCVRMGMAGRRAFERRFRFEDCYDGALELLTHACEVRSRRRQS